MSIKLAIEGEREEYVGGGARLCMHGYVCQLNLCCLNFLRAYRSGYKFYLGSEDSRIKDYDDMILKYEDEGGRETGLYFQSKHIQNCDDMAITSKHLLIGKIENNRKEERFMLSKYYESYLKNEIQSKEHYFIIYTNMDLDIEDLSRAGINVALQSSENTSHFFQIKSDGNTNCYKLSVDENHPLFERFYSLSDAYKVASDLVEVIKGQKKLEMKNEVIKKYKGFLRLKVLVRSDIDEINRQFAEEFISCETLSPNFKTFRNIFKKLYYEKISPNYGFEHDDEFKEDLRKKRIQVSQSFLVWDEGSPTEIPDPSECIKSFFNEFVLAVKQPNVVELEEIIKKEMEEIFSLKGTELIVPIIKSKMLDWMNDKTGTWLTRDDAESFILGIKQNMETLMSRGTSLDYQNELNGMNCIIRPNELEEDNTVQDIKFFLQSECAIMLISSDQSLLSLLKVHQGIIWIKERNVFKCIEKDDDLLFLSFGCLVASERVRNDLMSNNAFNLLVSHIQGTPLNDIGCQEYLKDLLNSVVSKRRKIILVFQKVFSDAIGKIIEDIGWEERILNYPSIIKDKSISFLQLDEEVQNRLLRLKIVDFQGEFTNLLTFSSEIKNIIDAETFLCLLQNEHIHVGQEIICPDPYIPRQLYLTDNLSEASNEDSTPTFISEDEVLSNGLPKVVIICGEPKTGKSYLVPSLSKKLKMKYPSIWVLKIDLNDFADICNKMGLHTTLNEQYSYAEDMDKTIYFIIEKLLEAPSHAKITSRFEKELLKLGFKGEIKLALLIDGLSELSKDGSRFVLQLLLGIQKTNVEMLVITTRPDNKRKLGCLQGKYFSLDSFEGNNNLNRVRLSCSFRLPRNLGHINSGNVERLMKILPKKKYLQKLLEDEDGLTGVTQCLLESDTARDITNRLFSITHQNDRSASPAESIINKLSYIIKDKLDVISQFE